MTVNGGASPKPDVIESGHAPSSIGLRLHRQALNLGRSLLRPRVLVGIALLAAATALAVAVQQYRHRVAAENRVSLATDIHTGVSPDLATRTLLVDLFIDNRSPYPVTLVNIGVLTPGLSVVPGNAGNDARATQLPARVPGQQPFETTLILRAVCTNPLPQTPEFRLVTTSNRGERRVVLLPPFRPLAQSWALSVRDACFAKPQ